MSQSALQKNVRKYGFPRLDVLGIPLLPARAQRLRTTRLCQCRGPPPDIVTVSVQGTRRRRDCQCRGPADVVTWREPFRARPSRGSSRSAWGKDPEGRTPACPVCPDSFPGSPPCPFL